MTTPALPARPRALVPEDLTRPTGPPARPVYRAAVATALAGLTDGESAAAAARRAYPQDQALPVVLRAASAVADTSTSGWASQLLAVQTVEWIASLKPSVFAQLAGIAPLRPSFDNGQLPRIPSRDATPTVAGSFVAEGAPIAVRKLNLSSTILMPKKLATISSYSNEIARSSVPDFEMVLRVEIANDTGLAIDSILLDATAATSIRPGGLRAGVAGLTPTAGGGFAAMIGDLQQLVAGIAPAQQPVLIANPKQALSIALTQSSGVGLEGITVIVSPNVAAGMLIAIDAADFVVATGLPSFAVTQEAVLHEEDTTPAALSSAGTPNTVAAPERSYFQTDCLALRMTMRANWLTRRTNAVSWLQAATW